MSKIQKYIVLGFALLLNTVASWGQISGRVVDTNKEPLEGIVIALLNSPDSTYINGTITDSIGHFAFTETSLPKTCIIRAEGIGYKKKDITVKHGSPCEITLTESELSLSEVTITPPSLTVSHGKFTFFPGEIASHVNNGLDLLGYAPLVFVNKNKDIVDIIGKEQTAIYINGKEPIGGDYAAIQMLRAADPSRIQRIEIIMQPKFSDSKYEAIINIIMPPLVGNVVTADVYFALMNARLSSRQQVFYYGEYDRWQFSASVGAVETHSKENMISSYTVFDEASSDDDLTKISESEATEDSNWFNISFGGNLDLGHKNSIGISARFHVMDTKEMSTDLTTFQQTGITQETFSKTKNPYAPIADISINYDHKLDSLGSTFSAKAGWYLRNNNYSRFNNPESQILATESPYTNRSFQIEAAWEKVFNNKFSFEIGTKAYHDRLHIKRFESESSYIEPDMTLTDNFRYLQSQVDIFAAIRYDLSNVIGFNIGATGQLYERIIDQYIQNLHRTYSDFYVSPRATLSLSFNPNNLLTITYNNKLQQPYYFNINPIVIWNTPTSYSHGNPDLKPMISNNFSLTYILLQKIVLAGNMSLSKNIVRWSRQPSENGITVDSPTEIGKSNNTNLIAAYQNTFFNYRWNFMGQVQWSYNYYSEYDVPASYGISSNNSSQWTFTLNNDIYLGKSRDWNPMLTLTCESPINEPFYKRGWRTDMNVVIRKQFKWGGALTFSIYNLIDNRPKSHDECNAYAKWSKNTGSRREVLIRFDITLGKDFSIRKMGGNTGMGGE